MRPGFDLNAFSSVAAMMDAALGLSVGAIAAGLAARGQALALLSGGSTPLPLYRALAATPLDWPRVTFALVDERWVGPDHPASNERAVRAAFAGTPAAQAAFVGLKTDAPSPAAALAGIEARVARLVWPADLCVLGMGPDGHTASWFPNAEGLSEALDDDAPRVAAIRARPSAVTGETIDRMTLTAPLVLSSRRLVLLMAGEDKRGAYGRARGSGPVDDMPVRALFGAPRENVFALWAP